MKIILAGWSALGFNKSSDILHVSDKHRSYQTEYWHRKYTVIILAHFNALVKVSRGSQVSEFMGPSYFLSI